MNDAAPKQYAVTETEKKWQDYWLAAETYRWDPAVPRADSYVIDTPPPTVSGFLHMGHIYSYTQTDVIARFQRMHGKNVFYPIGFDDNGLPTERLVEKQRKIRAVDTSREEFIRICNEEVQTAEQDFRALFRSIGLSVDWRLEYQTISPLARRISQLSVLDMFDKQHLYRQMQPTLWDPVDRTALAQAEITEKENTGTLWQIAFDVEGGGMAEIATTRPELLGACGALMIHPEHPRAGELVGRNVVTPLFRVPVPVVADERVDPEKGTGMVMCCTFGDTTDIEWWREHKLPLRVIVTREGRLSEMEGIGGEGWPSLDLESARAAAAELAGLKINAAREKIIALLTEAGRVTGSTAVVRMVPSAERSGAPLEILVTPQWFVRVLDKKAALIEKGREINWFPDYMRQRFEIWTENLKWDWCISRQRYFGVPFPFWYSKRAGEEGRIIPAHPDDLPVNPLVDAPRGYSHNEVEPDPDVMDTWATSSVSPQINSQNLSAARAADPARHANLFPADLRPQAHEIIRTWAFYTILKSYLHEDSVPWRNAAISGWALASDGSKQSKSKGNAVGPRDLLAKYGADVVRYWTATSRLGLDTVLSEDVLKVGKRLQTKLWNAARFAMLQLDGFAEQPSTPAADVENGIITAAFDRWILSRLARTVKSATEKYLAYEYADAMEAIERFFWSDLCDNYLELVKGRIYGEIGDAAGRRSAQFTLWHCLETVLRLFAPVMSHLTEELYQAHFPARFAALGSIHARGAWPKIEEQAADETADALGQAGVAVLAAVRKVKSERKVSLKTPVKCLHVARAEAESPALDGVLDDLAYTVSAEETVWHDQGTTPGEAVTTEDGNYRLTVELAPAA
ncbi:MAG TPA: valine--tRNA ligase [Aliidongia sp.]|nr:valine--tRNA ligase [Aliidongia sp.]